MNKYFRYKQPETNNHKTEGLNMDRKAIEARRIYMREYRKKNAEKLKAYRREWYRNNPDKVKAMRERFYLKAAAKITEENNE